MKDQSQFKIDKADESKGEEYSLWWYYFKDDCQPSAVQKEIKNKYGISTSMECIKHLYKCGWFKDEIIEFLVNVPYHRRVGRYPITIKDYFANKEKEKENDT